MISFPWSSFVAINWRPTSQNQSARHSNGDKFNQKSIDDQRIEHRARVKRNSWQRKDASRLDATVKVERLFSFVELKDLSWTVLNLNDSREIFSDATVHVRPLSKIMQRVSCRLFKHWSGKNDASLNWARLCLSPIEKRNKLMTRSSEDRSIACRRRPSLWRPNSTREDRWRQLQRWQRINDQSWRIRLFSLGIKWTIVRSSRSCQLNGKPIELSNMEIICRRLMALMNRKDLPSSDDLFCGSERMRDLFDQCQQVLFALLRSLWSLRRVCREFVARRKREDRQHWSSFQDL